MLGRPPFGLRHIGGSCVGPLAGRGMTPQGALHGWRSPADIIGVLSGGDGPGYGWDLLGLGFWVWVVGLGWSISWLIYQSADLSLG